MIAKARYRCFFCTVALCCSTATALPPLGLTQVSTSSTLQPNLEVIDGTAYLSVTNGIWTVDATGSKAFIPISHPTLGTPSSVTRAVKALDGDLYVATNFSVSSYVFQPTLFRLNQPTAPIMTWDFGLISAIDSKLRAFGTLDNATVFYPDGTLSALPFPTGSDQSNNHTWVTSATPNGYILGEGGIPGTIGSSPLLWTPDESFESFVFGWGSASSIRDRNDGQGVNIGNAMDAAALLGEQYYYNVVSNDGKFFSNPDTIVSQSDFFVVQEYSYFTQTWENYAFYPGIIPDYPDRALPLLDIFPELASIDINRIHVLASVDGFLYMTLSGSDGTFLFGARDPSVAIPEPATAAMVLFVTILCAGMSRRR